LEGTQTWSVLKHFGIQLAPSDPAPPGSTLPEAILEVHSDASFGPLIRLTQPRKQPLVRITPLTDQDLREISEIAELASGCGMDELLGRISQLIEELPWICGMQARIRGVADDNGSCRAMLCPQVKLGFSSHESVTC
jgi:hypothetical protein